MKGTKHSGDMTGSGAWAGSMPSNAWDTNEDSFWRNKFEHEGYYQKGMSYDDYEPAYRFGHEAYGRHTGKKWEEVEHDMGSEWEKVKAKSRLKWEHAKDAVKAAWEHMEGHARGHKHHEPH